MTKTQQQMSTETALQLLTEPRRRRILQQIAETSGGTAVDQLTNDQGGTNNVHSRGTGTSNTDSIEDRHVHLPKLEDADVIEYSSTQGTVQRGQHFEDVFSMLQVIENRREDTAIQTS